MGVKSQDIRDSDVNVGTISRAALQRSRTNVEKIFAWGILALSWLGAIVTAHGGWNAMLTTPSIGAICGGIAVQVVLTYLEWAYDDIWYIAWPARLIDALTTALGYGFLFVGALALLFAPALPNTPWTLAWWIVTTCGLVAWGIIYLVSLVAAWYPEKTLVQ